MIDLRPYQTEALDELAVRWVELNRMALAPHILLVSRTGTGKTVIAGEFMRRVLAKGRRCAFVVRDRTLLDQTSRHLDRIGLTHHGVVAAGHRRKNPLFPVQICSAQTLTSRGDAPPADVLVIDEAHGAVCDTSRAIVEAYPRATILGLTATPERADRKPLGRAAGGIFDRLIQVRCTFAELVALGALVPCEVMGPLTGKPEPKLARDPLASLRQHAGEPGAGRIRKTVIFGVDVAHARELATRAGAAGYRAACVDGRMHDREREARLNRIGLPGSDPDALDVITNCDLLTQGWDCPPVEVLIAARAFGSWSGWMQAIGRILRPHPGKLAGLVDDLRGSVWAHGLPSDDREFSLDGEAVRAPAAKLPALTWCRGCGCTHRSAGSCPRCGLAAPRAPAPAISEKPMGAVTDAGVADYGQKWRAFERLVLKQRAKRYDPKWVGVQFKNRFGHWPPWPLDRVRGGKTEERHA